MLLLAPFTLTLHLDFLTKDKKMTNINLNDYVSVPKAAKLAKVSEKWMRQLIIDGKVKGMKVGRNYLVDRKSAIAFDRHPTAGRPRGD